jgi:translocator protein
MLLRKKGRGVPPLYAECRVFQNVEPPFRGAAPGSVFALIGFVGLCLLVGAADGAITAGAVRGWYLSLTAPPVTPPRWVFGPVSCLLSVPTGLAGWLIWRDVSALFGVRRPLRLWGWQLLLSSFWAPAFFGLHSPLAGFLVMVPLLVVLALTLREFARVDRLALALMVPYGIWVTFAFYLNLGFWWLNGA